MGHPYDKIVHKVEKPLRYMGGEFNSTSKNWDDPELICRFALCFPDLYDIGMSHLGTKILYSLINKYPYLVMERCFCPWTDMENALREENLPLLSLENHRILSEFDVIGFSLQYEMTYTNVLTMLDLGNVPLRSCDRSDQDPIVLAGGPCATHPEAIAPFIDAIVPGDAEKKLPRILQMIGKLKKQGVSREEILYQLALSGGVYCPEFYKHAICEKSSLAYLTATSKENLPLKIKRNLVENLADFPFPDDSPVALAEAVFDRMSIEISRGCTEGCRFCQAGMIYRPVRERDPQEVIDTLLRAIKKGGYDEVSLTSLSTADYSCVSPLVHRLMEVLKKDKVGLGISSLRAYGLSEDLLNEIGSVKNTGLTFAPEAGTQRLRDLINKNINEKDILDTCERVFSRGWSKMKLYFMIGLPTETEEDIIGIAEMGRQAIEIGKQHSKAVKVTVSVSSHVPKPHTPFQWCAMDDLDTLFEKQELLFQYSRRYRYKFRKHDRHLSHLEAIIGRGDNRVADLIESAWSNGARFDSWDDKLNWKVWQEALDEWEDKQQLNREIFLKDIDLDAHLPWEHIDIGLEAGFLESEFKRQQKNKLSLPCSKTKGQQVHHTNLRDAEADDKKLLCYNCGLACDMNAMREERLVYLKKLNAEIPLVREDETDQRKASLDRISKGLPPHDFGQGQKIRMLVSYSKLAASRLLSHLDMVRILPQILRRAQLPVYFSQGYSPKPMLSFGPALGMGTYSKAEFCEITLDQDALDGLDSSAILKKLREAEPHGIHFEDAILQEVGTPTIAHTLRKMDYGLFFSLADIDVSHIEKIIQQLESTDSFPLEVIRKGKKRQLDMKELVPVVSISKMPQWLNHIDGNAQGLAVEFSQLYTGVTNLKPIEIAAVLCGTTEINPAIIRLAGWTTDENGDAISMFNQAK
jgi:radical SAM family uncharacterized protein/radical SAM-linked protein